MAAPHLLRRHTPRFFDRYVAAHQRARCLRLSRTSHRRAISSTLAAALPDFPRRSPARNVPTRPGPRHPHAGRGSYHRCRQGCRAMPVRRNACADGARASRQPAKDQFSQPSTSGATDSGKFAEHWDLVDFAGMEKQLAGKRSSPATAPGLRFAATTSSHMVPRRPSYRHVGTIP